MCTPLTRTEPTIVVVQHHAGSMKARMVPEVFDRHVVDVGDRVLAAKVVAAQAHLAVPTHIQFAERKSTSFVVERVVERERCATVVSQTTRHLVGIVFGDRRQQTDTAALLGVVVRNARFQRNDVVFLDVDFSTKFQSPLAV